MTPLLSWTLLLVVVGGAIGGTLLVLSVSAAPRECPLCGQPLLWWDVITATKCKGCGATVRPR